MVGVTTDVMTGTVEEDTAERRAEDDATTARGGVEQLRSKKSGLSKAELPREVGSLAEPEAGSLAAPEATVGKELSRFRSRIVTEEATTVESLETQ